MTRGKKIPLNPIAAHGILSLIHQPKILALLEEGLDPTKAFESPDNFFSFVQSSWITKAVPGGESHGCITCAQMFVTYSVVVPFLHDVGCLIEDPVVSVGDDGVVIGNPQRKLLAIRELGIWCNDGRSRSLQTRLKVELFTEEGAKNEFVWDAPVPKPGWFNRKQMILVPEVESVLCNDLYSSETREILALLMDRLCVSPSTMARTGRTVADLARQVSDTFSVLLSK